MTTAAAEPATPSVSLRRDGHVARITLDRPQALNAISGALAEELTAACEEVAADREVWVVVLSASGEKAFCVGADLKERAGFSLEQFYDNRRQIKDMFAAVRSIPQPVIASVFGYALGDGFELALSCDLIVAADDARFGLPEARVGLLPAGGGTQLLARRIGTGRAKDLIFRARQISAFEAAEVGLVSDVCPRSELEERTLALADEVCGSSPVAVREAKRCIEAALGVPLEEGIEVEHESWKKVIASADRPEGIAAFAEKRQPQWRNE